MLSQLTYTNAQSFIPAVDTMASLKIVANRAFSEAITDRIFNWEQLRKALKLPDTTNFYRANISSMKVVDKQDKAPNNSDKLDAESKHDTGWWDSLP
jgi:hypothetical protein